MSLKVITDIDLSVVTSLLVLLSFILNFTLNMWDLCLNSKLALHKKEKLTNIIKHGRDDYDFGIRGRKSY